MTRWARLGEMVLCNKERRTFLYRLAYPHYMHSLASICITMHLDASSTIFRVTFHCSCFYSFPQFAVVDMALTANRKEHELSNFNARMAGLATFALIALPIATFA